MNLYALARKVGWAKAGIAALRGDPEPLLRRAKNRVVSNGLRVVGFWTVWNRIWR